jgi:hypothetical protein
MKRKDVLIRFGSYIVVLVMLAGLLNSCTNKDKAGSVNFTIDLTDPMYSSLNSIGGYAYVSNIIVFKDVSNNYDALSEYCTYDANILQYMPSYNSLVCPGCHSQFDINGNPTFGYASAPLVKYNVQLIGSTLRIYTSS